MNELRRRPRLAWRAAGLAVLSLALFGPGPARGAPLRVAVAANFQATAQLLARDFTASEGVAVSLSSGSTGMLYAQIVQGAPFDLFLAADAERPARLEAEGRIVAGSRRPYALGRLVLWAPGRTAVGPRLLQELADVRIVIAEPRLAPYGRASREALEALGRWSESRGRLLRARNVAQAHQFLASGAAALGFVAAGQVRGRPAAELWPVPPRLHRPIVQEAVQLSDDARAGRFLSYLLGPRGRALIEAAGFALPPEAAP